MSQEDLYEAAPLIPKTVETVRIAPFEVHSSKVVQKKTLRRKKPLFAAFDCLALAVVLFVLVIGHRILFPSSANRWVSPAALSLFTSNLIVHWLGRASRVQQSDQNEDLGSVRKINTIGDSGPNLEGSITVDVAQTSETPNIVFMYIDDVGFNDFGAGSSDLSTFTPRMEELWNDGIWLSNYYGQHVCTPSRATLMTGKYPIHTGMQHGFISGNDPWGLPLSHRLLPQYLKAAGSYRTHMIGKWHLGHYTASLTPLERGFDSFYGYFTGFESYFSHTAEISLCKQEGDCYYDLHDDWTPVRREGVYNTDLFNEQAEIILANYKDTTGDPFFLYYAPGNMHQPLEVPLSVMKANEEKLSSIPNWARRTFAGMLMILDEAVGNVTDSLKANGLFDETVFILASDNGGNPQVDGAASNYPLRGMKGYVWEGGMRVHSFVRSSLIPEHLRGSSFGGLFHVSDWLPTLVEGVIGDKTLLADAELDGVNQWDALLGSTGAQRNELVYNLDYNDDVVCGALRVGDMKILRQVQYQPAWAVPEGNNLTEFDNWDWTNMEYVDFLFNLTADPTESNDLRETLPDVFSELNAILDKYEETMVDQAYCGSADNKAARKVFNKTQFITPWLNDTISCPETDAASSAVSYPDIDKLRQHTMQQYCVYSLLPTEVCAKYG